MENKVYIVEWKYNFGGSSIVAVLPSEEMAKSYIEHLENPAEAYYSEHEILEQF